MPDLSFIALFLLAWALLAILTTLVAVVIPARRRRASLTRDSGSPDRRAAAGDRRLGLPDQRPVRDERRSGKRDRRRGPPATV